MTFRIQDAGTLRTITKGTVRVAGINRPLKTIKVQDGGSLRLVATFADPLSVTAGGGLAAGASSSLTTNSVTATPSGGFAPYTYAWTLITNGGRNASTAGSPTSATTTFTKTGLINGDSIDDTWRVTVTDSIGQTATADTTASFIYISGA